RVVLEHRVQDGVRDLVAHLVRVALGHGLRGVEVDGRGHRGQGHRSASLRKIVVAKLAWTDGLGSGFRLAAVWAVADGLTHGGPSRRTGMLTTVASPKAGAPPATDCHYLAAPSG